MPTVAIIGNDAVLMVAPATPVQLAHACLRRGFTIAVPVSWGDELIASETVRRLAARDRGPAVMCVCPFVRSRLLAPGPDLAPFLVSLVSPPVATARYLRTVYGDHGVHITYIGGCPRADDASIDARLTPDAFLVDLAEHGIALAEQPLVFDSIVPPDRRRWCSLPGGSPTAEMLWAEADTRMLIEIERDDASTELAQHIIGREHVLLDLAPALGCVCSGAISSVPARSARVAVATVEPPRALGPVVDPAVVVSLDAPVADRSSGAAPRPDGDRADRELMEQRLDELLGTQITAGDAPPADEQHVIALEPAGPEAAHVAPVPAEEAASVTEGPQDPDSNPALAESLPITASEPARTLEPVIAESGTELTASTTPEDSLARSPEGPTAPDDIAPDRLGVRRRTPVPTHTRHPSSSIPKATASNGRALPRAYVAKRRTPGAGMPAVDALPDNTVQPDAVAERPEMAGSAPLGGDLGASPAAAPNSEDTRTLGISDAPAAIPDDAVAPPSPDLPTHGQLAAEPAVVAEGAESPASAIPATAESVPAAARSVPHVSPNNGVARETTPPPEPNRRGGAAAASAPNPSVFVILLLALIALAIFVLRSLG